jgi:hypothetical protein
MASWALDGLEVRMAVDRAVDKILFAAHRLPPTSLAAVVRIKLLSAGRVTNRKARRIRRLPACVERGFS